MYRECTCATRISNCEVHGNLPRNTPYEHCTNAIEIPPKSVITNGKFRPGAVQFEPTPVFITMLREEYDRLHQQLTEAITKNLVYEQQIERLEARLFPNPIDPEHMLYSAKKYLDALWRAGKADEGTDLAYAILTSAQQDVAFKDYKETTDKYRLAKEQGKL